MPQVYTEDTNLASALETTLGTIPTAGWRQHQPTTIGKIGNAIKKISRDIISSNRQREKGEAVDADSGLDVEFDLTKDAIDRDCEDLFKSAEKFSGGTGVGRFTDSAVTTAQFTVTAGGALAAGMLVYSRGHLFAANNGLFVVQAASTATAIKVTGTVAETSPTNSTVEVAGVQGAATDITIDANGNITSTTLDFTTLSLNVGQWMFVGDTIGTAFAFAAANDHGWCRIKIIAAHLLTVERRTQAFTADAGTGKTIRLLFGSWIRDIGSLHADYKSPSRTAELTLPKLGAASTTKYLYGRGLMINSWDLGLNPGDKVTVKASLIGTITDDPTATQATGASTPLTPVIGAINMVTTSSDLARLQLANIDETGISTDFKSMMVKLTNNVAAEKQLATFGASKLNVGGFDVSIDATFILNSDASNDGDAIIKAVRDNRSSALALGMRNLDFACLWDFPTVTVDDAPLELARNESVRVKGRLTAVRDQTLGYTASLSRIPYCPAV